MKTAIIIGHGSLDGGAVNKTSGISEYKYNCGVADHLKDLLGMDVELVYRTGRYSEVAGYVNATGADLAISLHCNAFDQETSGSETLSSGSTKSLAFAGLVHSRVVSLFELPNRGIKIRDRNDRGGLVLHDTNMPCVLLEPFFIDNGKDFEKGRALARRYALAICAAINEYEKI